MVVRDRAAEAIKRLVSLDKSACKFIRSYGEDVSSYIERFFIPAQAYPDLHSHDKFAASSQNLALTMMTNAKLSHDTFANIIANLVITARQNHLEVSVSIRLEPKKVEKFIDLLPKFNTFISEAINSKQIKK